MEHAARIGFVAALAILVLIGGLSYLGSRSLIETEDAVFRSQDVINQLDDVLVDVLEEESAARGFLAAGQDFYLEPYANAARRIDGTLADLQAAVSGDLQQRQTLEEIKAAVAEKLAYHKRMIELRRQSGAPASLQLFFTGRGHALMDQIRDGVKRMKARENRFLRQYTRQARRRTETWVLTQVTGSLLSFGILVFVYYHLDREIGRRRQSERKILRLNRLYAVLSRANQAIVRIRDRQALFDAICRIAVEDDLFRMAWMGVVEPESGRVLPVASAGFVDNYLEHIHISTSDSAEGQGPTGRALRERRYFVCSDISDDPRVLPWRKDALARGYRSSAAFPILTGESVAAVFTVYAAETGFFDEQVVALLTEVASDISFALEAMQAEARRSEAEENLRAREHALGESEERFRQMAENIEEMFWITDAGLTRMLYVSPVYERIWGRSCQSLYDDPQSFVAAVHPEDRPGVEAGIQQALADPGKEWNREYRVVRPDGSIRWVWDRGFPVRDAAGKLYRFAGITQDITERKQAEEQILRLNEDLERRVAERTAELARVARELELRNQEVERANRLKSEFLARMSHELRTPLNAIVGYSDLLAEQPAGPLAPTYLRFASNIQEGAQHLLLMVNDLLDLSKIEAGRIELHREIFSSAQALAEVLSVLTPLARIKSIAIEQRLPAHTRICADRTRFKQILYNLLSNAVKFTPESGRVWVAECHQEDSARFCVGDTGSGIPESELAAIFEEFHQVDAASGAPREGTGLGLAITRRLAELHGGSVWVESAPGKGSRFYFSLGPGSLETALETGAESPDICGPSSSQTTTA
jgi:PAS domain S-box-containing protein